MRHELERVERRGAAEHAAAEHDQPAVLEHPPLPPVLVLDVAGRLLPRARRPGRRPRGGRGGRGDTGARGRARSAGRARRSRCGARRRSDRHPPSPSRIATRPRAAGPRTGRRRLRGSCRRRPRSVGAADVGDLRVGEAADEQAEGVGAQSVFASENATISPLVAATARSCAATLPPRGTRRSRTRSSRAAAVDTTSSVPSVDASEATTSSSRSAG